MHELSDAQFVCKQQILDVLRVKDVCLLHGVTGSGKTEVYVHLMCEALERGEECQMQVSECP